MLHRIRPFYLTGRFFSIAAILVIILALSFAWPVLISIALVGAIVLVATTLADAIILFMRKEPVTGERELPRTMGLNDDNAITLHFANNTALRYSISIIDELPVQFQKRDFLIETYLKGKEKKSMSYVLKPLKRGEYIFHDLNVFIRSVIGLAERRLQFDTDQSIAVYPSVLQMKQYELIAFTRISTMHGVKRLRRIGHSYEFEQIQNYVKGDDYRSINWKATGRRGNLMVNRFQDERSQQVYCIIDKSRTMHMPFDGLTLLDYAINSALVMSNIIIKKHDKAGLLTFSDKIGSVVKADSSARQLHSILEALYREEPREKESDFELLYRSARRLVQGRSLLILFTNFESINAAERVLPLLRKINRLHLLVVIFFDNDELRDFAESEPDDMRGIYYRTVSRSSLLEKQQIVNKLQQFGIQAVLTKPKDLSINTLNKYLELKSRGLI